MSPGSVKILTVGSAVGSVRDLFAKIKAIDAKHGKFDLVLCTGDFFGPPSSNSTDAGDDEDEISLLLGGRLEATVECYIMQGRCPLPQKVIEKFSKTGGELCKNVFLMAHGLRIACLGGVYDAEVYDTAEAPPGFVSPYFSAHTTERLLANTLSTTSTSKNYQSLASIQSTSTTSQAIDILLSNAWPSLITSFSTSPVSQTDLVTVFAPPLDDIVRHTQPRYHFAVGAGTPPTFWEREPFVWEGDENRVTRFVGLGAFGGEAPPSGKKQRWFYAFSISPKSAASTSRLPNATPNPFSESATRRFKRSIETSEGNSFIFGNVHLPTKRTRTIQGEPGKPPPGYKCRRCESTEHFINDCPERAKPPEGYVCKLCNETHHRYSLAISFATVRPEMLSETPVARNQNLATCAAHVAVRNTTSKIAWSPGNPKAEKDALVVEDRPKKSLLMNAGSAYRILVSLLRIAGWILSNGDTEGNPRKHLIVSIGSEVYVTLPKGQIIPTQSSADRVNVPGGGHVLIVPITHYPTYTTIPSDLAPPIIEETGKYKSALRAFFAKHSCSIVMFEVGRLSAKGGHAHVQAVPIPRILENQVEDAFIREGRTSGIDFEADADEAMNICAGGRGNYFKVELPDGRKMVHLIRGHVPFNLQFGR
ncbi:hypothetical protein P691DRAFT_786180 [Macrolepiota fuliginosa MF-IS2]|uniref:CCHC-type domain-containing protein n=1 Tax=Macrolepiota fuliginosa MF-IS2 TaxID=1400762 RepID=A0A9P5XPK9_9AGAR|nr:hypothetical protein P691DRAFT_786180 [Macrolepiota fuliginosa MF-IS2]